MATAKTDPKAAAAAAPAAPAGGDPAAAHFSDVTLYELRRTLSKINTLVGMVVPRMEQIRQSKFPLFGELMEIYYGAAKQNVNEGHDFVENGVRLTAEQQKQVDMIVRFLFSGEEPSAEENADK